MQDHILKFSVIIPLYNKEISVRSTVESVLNQTWPHFELVIINDGSTDNSLSVVKSFKDPRIRVVSQNNNGVSNARNRGIKESKNDYIVFLDADDLWKPYALEEFVYLINNFPEASVYSANLTLSNRTVKGSMSRYYVNDYYYQAAILLAKWNLPLLVMGSVAFKRFCIEVVGGFVEDVAHGEDVGFWDRISEHFLIAKSERVVLTYRLNAENRASNLPEDQKKFSGSFKAKRPEETNNSMRLYYGCLLFDEFFLSIRRLKIKRAKEILFTDFNWIFRASFLFFKHRILTR